MSDYNDRRDEKRGSQEAWNDLETDRLTRRGPAQDGLNGVFQSWRREHLDGGKAGRRPVRP